VHILSAEAGLWLALANRAKLVILRQIEAKDKTEEIERAMNRLRDLFKIRGHDAIIIAVFAHYAWYRALVFSLEQALRDR
jgi:hypothetical protein